MRLSTLALALVGTFGLGCAADPSRSPQQQDPPPSAIPLPPCEDPHPLSAAIEWDAAPFDPPGKLAPSETPDDDFDDSYDGGDGGEVGFVIAPEVGSVDITCDVWTQDCPRGQKCAPWANDGGREWNATKCVELDAQPAEVGEACTVEGSRVSGIDDCILGALCWEPDDETLRGTCVSFCEGNLDRPVCSEPRSQCWALGEGTAPLCLPDTLCAADGECHCSCPGADPDCAAEQCAHPTPAQTAETRECPSSPEPVVVYMSNDDSNSQASPTLARQTIREGRLVNPWTIRIHEFLNYFDLTRDNPRDRSVALGLELRPRDPALGEFALLATAQGRALDPDERPRFNLVFSLDSSGSMSGNSMNLLKATMTAIAGNLQQGDVVSVVTWNTVQTVALDGLPVSGPSDPRLVQAIHALAADGGTDLHAGLVRAYALASEHHIDDGINRVVLISDGGANTGVTDIDIIAGAADDENGEGTYLVGVGVGSSHSYSDALMDSVTDAGKGAYVFVDSREEAERSFGEHFLANMAVAARDVHMKVTLPWYFGIRQFHGEEYSSDPAKVDPQHLAPNDAMAFHQIIGACDPSYVVDCDVITAEVTYREPITNKPRVETLSLPFRELVQRDASLLRKTDAVVAYAEALITIGTLTDRGDLEGARQTARDVGAWMAQTAEALADAELHEIAGLLREYEAVLEHLLD